MRAVADFARRGGHVLGICNGFQVLIETGLLPGALMRNAALKFVCAPAALTVATDASAFTGGYARGERIRLPIAHHDGNYVADDATLARLEGEDRVAFRYATNPNGSAARHRRHPLGEPARARPDAAPRAGGRPGLGGTDGARLFAGLAGALGAGALQTRLSDAAGRRRSRR